MGQTPDEMLGRKDVWMIDIEVILMVNSTGARTA